ncbi:hypothetical protein NMY22_g11580 [Coprinellus aureogranulatus]|nr:hypothetical protein NMY22_g11580 [Coprinellus aureogranulatus]
MRSRPVKEPKADNTEAELNPAPSAAPETPSNPPKVDTTLKPLRIDALQSADNNDQTDPGTPADDGLDAKQRKALKKKLAKKAKKAAAEAEDAALKAKAEAEEQDKRKAEEEKRKAEEAKVEEETRKALEEAKKAEEAKKKAEEEEDNKPLIDLGSSNSSKPTPPPVNTAWGNGNSRSSPVVMPQKAERPSLNARLASSAGGANSKQSPAWQTPASPNKMKKESSFGSFVKGWL